MTRRMQLIVAAALIVGACDADPTGPPEPILAVVEVDPAQVSVVVGDTVRLAAHPKTAAGEPITVTTGLTWSAEPADNVTLLTQGLHVRVTALVAGPVTVRATVGARTGEASIAVLPPPAEGAVSSVMVDPADGTLSVGASRALMAALRTADGTIATDRAVEWTSSDTTVVTVERQDDQRVALLRAVGAGSATVTATSEGVSGTATFLVPTPVDHVFVQPSFGDGVWENHATQFRARTLVNLAEVTDRVITFSVEDTTVASITANGLLVGRVAGRTRVVAESEGVRGYADIRVYRLEPRMTFHLTYDWWDGVPQIAMEVGSTVWTDDAGVEHAVSLYAHAGTFTIDRTTGAWERVIQARGWVWVDGSPRLVAEETLGDSGAMYYRWNPYESGGTTFDFVSTATPGLVFQGAFRRGGELMVSMPAYGGVVYDVLFRLPDHSEGE